jgi:hypothetical protein
MYYVISIEFRKFSDFSDQCCQVDSPIDLRNSIHSSHPLAPVTLNQSTAIDWSTAIDTTHRNLSIRSIILIRSNVINRLIATDRSQPTDRNQPIHLNRFEPSQSIESSK